MCFMDVAYLMFSSLLPGNRACLAVVPRQLFQVEHIDDAIAVEVRHFRDGRVVAHTDGEGVELVDHVVPVNVTRQ